MSADLFRKLLAAEFAPFADLSEEQLSQLERHYALLLRWNERLNLTRINELKDIVRLHFCESLFLATALPPGPLRIVDVGSGAGFPGIPLSIARPESCVHLVESHQRKAVFLRESSRELKNVRVLSQRAEELSNAYDWVVSRGVRPLDVRKLRISSNFALLVGSDDVSCFPGEHLKSPWGHDRYLIKFHVEQNS